MEYITEFRNDIDGYDFPNHWEVDENDIAATRRILDSLTPSIISLLTPFLSATLPLLGPILPGFEGIASCFLPYIIAPTLIEQVKDKAARGFNARCAGMAYSSIDYFERGWLVPSMGVNFAGTASAPNEFGAELRTYILHRQLDSHLANGAQFVFWYVLLLLLGDIGKGEIRKHTLSELEKLKHILQSGKPWPIGLLSSDTSNLSKSHVVVATSFREINANQCEIGIYENNNPDSKAYLRIDVSRGDFIKEFTMSVDKQGRYQPENYHGNWAGLFCTNYIPTEPPIGISAQSQVWFTPHAAFAQIEQPFGGKFKILNQTLTNERSLKWALSDTRPSGKRFFIASENAVLHESNGSVPNIEATVPLLVYNPSKITVVPAVAVFGRFDLDAPLYKVLPDNMGNPILASTCIIYPKPEIKLPRDQNCTPLIVEGKKIRLTTDSFLYSHRMGIQWYEWEVISPYSDKSNNSFLELQLPSPPSSVTIQLTVYLSDGHFAQNKIQIEPFSVAMAEAQMHLCKVLNELDKIRPDVLPKQLFERDPKEPYYRKNDLTLFQSMKIESIQVKLSGIQKEILKISNVK